MDKALSRRWQEFGKCLHHYHLLSEKRCMLRGSMLALASLSNFYTEGR